MLIIKAYVNKRQIDEIHIHNMGVFSGHDGLYMYKIEKPKGYEGTLIPHRRSDGWQVLAEEALKVLTESKKK